MVAVALVVVARLVVGLFVLVVVTIVIPSASGLSVSSLVSRTPKPLFAGSRSSSVCGEGKIRRFDFHKTKKSIELD